jgi:mRNA-degrading endonuclease RelE of RelBE toxin-antitoxin system
MTTEVRATPKFEREFSRLARKFPSVINELAKFIDILEQDERPGDRLSGTGFVVYKARLNNQSAGKGKSGGFRVIYFAQFSERVVLLAIYAKVTQTDIPLAALRQLIQELPELKE